MAVFVSRNESSDRLLALQCHPQRHPQQLPTPPAPPPRPLGKPACGGQKALAVASPNGWFPAPGMETETEWCAKNRQGVTQHNGCCWDQSLAETEWDIELAGGSHSWVEEL